MSSINTFLQAVSRRSSPSGLKTGSAVAAVLALTGYAGEAAAQSREVCGPPVNGVVSCQAGDPYNGGIGYLIDTPSGDFELGLEDGLELVSEGGGITVINPYGGVRIVGPQSDIAMSADFEIAVHAYSGLGDITIDLGDISTAGLASHGILAEAEIGDIAIKANDILTLGDTSFGVDASTNAGDVSIDLGFVNTRGAEATGVRAFTADGHIGIKVGVLEADGFASGGIAVLNLSEDGRTDVEVGRLRTDNHLSMGIDVIAVNDIRVVADEVFTVGIQSHGIATLSLLGDQVIEAGRIGTFRDEALGVLAESRDGDVSVRVSEVSTGGQASHGVLASSVNGDVSVAVDSVRTDGADARGVIAFTDFGRTTVDIGSIFTSRDLASGVYAGGGAGVTLRVDDVLTSGFGATGVQAVAGNLTPELETFGDAFVEVGRVETRNNSAAGVSVVAVGDVDIRAGTVKTLGELSTGIETRALAGEVRLVVDSLETQGDGSTGVFAANGDGDVNIVLGSAVTRGAGSSVIFADVEFGDLDVAITGDVQTYGPSARGVISSSLFGDTRIATRGVIRTEGDGSEGIYASLAGSAVLSIADVRTLGDEAVGIRVFATGSDFVEISRSVDIEAGAVTTAGAFSHGISASNLDGGIITRVPAQPAPFVVAADEVDADIRIRARSIAVTGEGANGIFVQGVAGVSAVVGDVSSTQDAALHLEAQKLVSAEVLGAVTGGGDAAVSLTGEDVSLHIGAQGRATGSGDALTLSAVGPYVPPEEGPIGPFAVSPGLVELDNAGAIIAGGGAAIRVTAGSLSLANSGRIDGAFALADGDDQIVNTGTVTVRGDSDFGDGLDAFTNRGVVAFGQSPGALSAVWTGLERFLNDGGLVDLSNGRAGDVLTLTGAYAGTGDARLGLDLGAETSDRLVIAGAATGATTLVLTRLVGSEALLTKAPLSLVTVGAGSAADAFRLGNADQGLVQYDLSYDAATRAYRVEASAGRAVRQSLGLAEILGTASQASTDAVFAEQALSRTGEGGRVWAQAFGQRLERDAEVDGLGAGYEQEDVGGQMGARLGQAPAFGGTVVWGVTGGYARSTVTYEDQGQDIDVATLNAGGTLAWSRGDLFATGLVKVDRHAVDVEDAAAAFEADLDATAFSAQVLAGYRFDIGPMSLRPHVGLDWTSTSIDDLEALGQSVSFDDQQGLSGRLGAEAFTRHDLGEGKMLGVAFGLEGVHHFDTEQRGVLNSGGQTDEVVLAGLETYGRATATVQLETSGLQTFVQGEARFGDGQGGGGVRIGARYRF